MIERIKRSKFLDSTKVEAWFSGVAIGWGTDMFVQHAPLNGTFTVLWGIWMAWDSSHRTERVK